MSSVTVKELDALVESIFTLRKEYEALDEKLSLLNKEIKAREQRCVDYLKELRLETFKGRAGTVTPYEKVAYTVPKTPEERESFFSHLRSEGIFENMVTVNYQTLNSYANEFYEAAKARGDLFATIPGLGAPTITTILSKTKAKGAV